MPIRIWMRPFRSWSKTDRTARPRLGRRTVGITTAASNWVCTSPVVVTAVISPNAPDHRPLRAAGFVLPEHLRLHLPARRQARTTFVPREDDGSYWVIPGEKDPTRA